MSYETINTPCPSCGWKSLFIGNGGYLTCGNITDCRQPNTELAIKELRLQGGKYVEEQLRSAPKDSWYGTLSEAIKHLEKESK